MNLPNIKKPKDQRMYRLFAIAILLFTHQLAQAEDWSEFLGLKGSASSRDTAPTTWSDYFLFGNLFAQRQRAV